MLIGNMYIDPIYIVLVTLAFVGYFLYRIDKRFRNIEKLLEGVRDASQATNRNSDHLRSIANNVTSPSYAIILRANDGESTGNTGGLQDTSTTQAIPKLVRRLDTSGTVFYEQRQ